MPLLQSRGSGPTRAHEATDNQAVRPSAGRLGVAAVLGEAGHAGRDAQSENWRATPVHMPCGVAYLFDG